MKPGTSRHTSLDSVRAVADAARDPAGIAARYGSRPVWLDSCICTEGTEVTDRGVYVPPGGAIASGLVMLRGARIRALPEGGFVIEAC